MEDLGHRMLSTTYVLGKSGATVSSYKTDELVRAASMLTHMSEDFYKDITAAEGIKNNKIEEEDSKMMRSNGFLSVYLDYLECPEEYVKEKEEEEKKKKEEEEREKKEKEEEQKRKEEKEKALEEKKKKDEEDRKRRKEEWMKKTAEDK